MQSFNPNTAVWNLFLLAWGGAHRFLILWGETKALIHSTVTQEGGFCTYQSKNVVWPRDPIIKLKRQEKAPFTLGPFIHSRARLCISLHMNKVSGLFYREMHQARGFNDKIMSRRGRYFFFFCRGFVLQKTKQSRRLFLRKDLAVPFGPPLESGFKHAQDKFLSNLPKFPNSTPSVPRRVHGRCVIHGLTMWYKFLHGRQIGHLQMIPEMYKVEFLLCVVMCICNSCKQRTTATL